MGAVTFVENSRPGADVLGCRFNIFTKNPFTYEHLHQDALKCQLPPQFSISIHYGDISTAVPTDCVLLFTDSDREDAIVFPFPQEQSSEPVRVSSVVGEAELKTLSGKIRMAELSWPEKRNVTAVFVPVERYGDFRGRHINWADERCTEEFVLRTVFGALMPILAYGFVDISIRSFHNSCCLKADAAGMFNGIYRALVVTSSTMEIKRSSGI